MSSGGVNPNPGNNINDLIFQGLSFAPLAPLISNPPIKPEAPKAATWLADQKRFVPLQTYPQIENFVMQFFNERNPLPEANDLIQYFDNKLETINPKTRPILTNPRTDTYSVVEAKVKILIDHNKQSKIFYSSPANDPRFANSRRSAILIADDHVHPDFLSTNFAILRSLYGHPDIHLSSGFIEGTSNIDRRPVTADVNLPGLDASVREQDISPNRAILYWLDFENQQNRIRPNAAYVSFNPEKHNKSKLLENFIEDIVLIASGVQSHFSDPEDFNKNAKYAINYLHHEKNRLGAIGMLHEFYSLAGSVLKRTLDKFDFQDSTKRAITSKAIELIITPPNESWSVHSIPQVLSFQEAKPLQGYVDKRSYEFFYIERQQDFATSFAEPEMGTRIMLTGKSHLTEPKGQTLPILLENKNIPVIIVGPKNMNLV